jgi:hypothetical protein
VLFCFPIDVKAAFIRREPRRPLRGSLLSWKMQAALQSVVSRIAKESGMADLCDASAVSLRKSAYARETMVSAVLIFCARD